MKSATTVFLCFSEYAVCLKLCFYYTAVVTCGKQVIDKLDTPAVWCSECRETDLSLCVLHRQAKVQAHITSVYPAEVPLSKTMNPKQFYAHSSVADP